jgi:ABC-type sugar transport system substrate-binding protein
MENLIGKFRYLLSISGARSKTSMGLAAIASAFLCGMNPIAVQAADGPIIFVAGPLSDPFFGSLKKGSDDAARDLGVTYSYLAIDISGPALGKAIQAAIASRPSGIAYGDWYPSAEDPLILQATQSGIPAVAVNAAGTDWTSTGAVAFVGAGDDDGGYLAGQQLGKAGVKNALCVNQAPGASNLERMCAGFARAIKEAGGVSTVLNIPYSDSSDPGYASSPRRDRRCVDARYRHWSGVRSGCRTVRRHW